VAEVVAKGDIMMVVVVVVHLHGFTRHTVIA
jgi:hypothetical protein